MCGESIDTIVPLFNHNSCFLLGKGNGESIAREGALKIKEISYIHAEGYSTSSLKHGPFALLHKDFPVVLIAPHNKHYAKNENAYEEIKSRHARIIYITNKEDTNKENVLKIASKKLLLDAIFNTFSLLVSLHSFHKASNNKDTSKTLAKVNSSFYLFEVFNYYKIVM